MSLPCLPQLVKTTIIWLCVGFREGEGEVVSGLLEEQVREGEVAAAPTQSAEGGGGGKKGKKGRKKKALEEEW